ncbi:membrane zinc transporter [Coccidioides immitis RMSCC 3703]|uniref:Membrane zinc transporter n=1 Tax=Coccidioides immitis RMSCC 3703 TaxID=454286 RepID=A0A0J8R5D9_COCIT|nr:membrane zinc transporter [Coccidioides immitis RMSCC 3703]
MDSLLTLASRQEQPSEPAPACDTGNEFDGHLGLRVSAVFVILAGSLLGALLPVLVRQDPHSRHNSRKPRVPSWVFFIAKFFGSGVIVATSFITYWLLPMRPLATPCLTRPDHGISLMVIRYAHFGHGHHDESPGGRQTEAGVVSRAEKEPQGSPPRTRSPRSLERPPLRRWLRPLRWRPTRLYSRTTVLNSHQSSSSSSASSSTPFSSPHSRVAGEEFKTLYVASSSTNFRRPRSWVQARNHSMAPLETIHSISSRARIWPVYSQSLSHRTRRAQHLPTEGVPH